MTEQADWRIDRQPKIIDHGNYIVKEFAEAPEEPEAPEDAEAPEEVGRKTIEVVPDEYGGIHYMYAAGEVLVRDQHIDPVLDILGEQRTRREIQQHEYDRRRIKHVIGDIFVVDLAGSRAFDVLRETDRVLGRGSVTPNQVLTVAGGAGVPCPATEPQEVYDEIEPFPPACRDGGGRGVQIYMTDTGLLADAESHPWLRHGVTGDPDPGDGIQPIPPYTGHGTFAAGVARCMAPEAEIFVDNEFKVAGSTLEAHLVRRLVRALRRGVDIFHLAIAAYSQHDLPLIALEAWLRLLRQYEGVVCVAAAGNSGLRRPAWPGVFSDVVCVGALGGDWRGRATFSNHGGWVDVYAPGRDLVNAYTKGEYVCQEYPYGGPQADPPPAQHRHFYGMAKWSGTSFSTPLVTGLIAARMSRTGENGRQAAAALLAEARANAIPGVGPILLPRCSDDRAPGRPGECGRDGRPEHRPHPC
jgi:Subtilase family